MTGVNECSEPSEDAVLIAAAIRNIAHGGVNGPDGLEAVAMALSGHGFDDNIASAIRYGFDEVASAIREGFETLARRDG